MDCKNCKWCRTDDIDREKQDYCYPPLKSGLFSVLCEIRKNKNPKQCLWLNNKISYREMVGAEENNICFNSADFTF